MNVQTWIDHFKAQADNHLPLDTYQSGYVYLKKHAKKKQEPHVDALKLVSPVQQAVQQARNEIKREELEDRATENKKSHKRKRPRTATSVRGKQRKKDVFD